MNNPTNELLQKQYAKRFLATVICVIVAAVTAYLTWLGRLNLIGWGSLVAALSGLAGWVLTEGLIARYKQLQQLRVMEEHGPYDRREFVPPQEAASAIGGDVDNNRNMWGSP
jgi:hypothetical protein